MANSQGQILCVTAPAKYLMPQAVQSGSLLLEKSGWKGGTLLKITDIWTDIGGTSKSALSGSHRLPSSTALVSLKQDIST